MLPHWVGTALAPQRCGGLSFGEQRGSPWALWSIENSSRVPVTALGDLKLDPTGPVRDFEPVSPRPALAKFMAWQEGWTQC